MADEKSPSGFDGTQSESLDARRARRALQRRPPPPSMWTAPQSRIPPPNPADQPSTQQAETYFRRVAAPTLVDGPRPTKGQRIANVAGGVLGGTIGLYLIFFHDFGTPDHVFMPIRRFFHLDPFNPLALSPEEKRWAHQRGLDGKGTVNGDDKLV